MNDLAIRTEGLKKSYGDIDAVKGIDLAVRKGEVFALLGPNGAGKTTTVEILEGHRTKSAGTVSVLGYDPASNLPEFRARVGIVLQETGVDPYLTVEETIQRFRGFYPHPCSLGEMLEVAGIDAQRFTPVRQLSGGQQRRLDVAIGLCGNPELLFLDEPTTGFDPAARRGAWDMIRNLQVFGKTVFLTTHYMDEAEALADRIAFMKEGTIQVEGSLAELRGSKDRTVIQFDLRNANCQLPATLLDLSKFEGNRVTIQTEQPTHVLSALTGWATAQELELQDLTVRRQSLEDLFLELTGEL